MALDATRVTDHARRFPESDGRGVLIGILDSGIDLGTSGLDLTSTGEPKVLDLRDFSGEGRIALASITPVGDAVVVGDTRLGGFGRVRSLSTTGPWYGGSLSEIVLGEMPATKPLPVAEPPLNQRDVKQGPAPKDGPDATNPYFADLAKGLSVPKEMWGPIYGAWNHFSTIAVCPNGDVLAVWYTCTQEEGRECAQAACRLRAGSDKWDAPSFFFGTPDCNTHAPVLLADGKRLYHFFTQSFAGWDDAADCMRVSEDSGATWSKPRVILSREDPLRMSQPCSSRSAPLF